MTTIEVTADDIEQGEPCEGVAFDLPIPDRYLANP